MQDDDRGLARRVAAGDMLALEVLYRRHVGRVWRYAWFRTHSREAAAEIVQETFLRVARSARQFEGRSRFTTWLFAVVRSVAINHLRKQRRERAVVGEPAVLRLVSGGSDPPERAEHADTRRAVREALTRLPAAQRDALVLCDLSELSMKAAAELLGWSVPRVKTTLFRARRRLRDELKTHEPAADASVNT